MSGYLYFLLIIHARSPIIYTVQITTDLPSAGAKVGACNLARKHAQPVPGYWLVPSSGSPGTGPCVRVLEYARIDLARKRIIIAHSAHAHNYNYN